MEYRLLGRSGLKVSTITMGTMTVGGVGWAKAVGDLGVNDARRLVDLRIDAGVNLIDTADAYSDSVCEEIPGEIVSGPRKNGVLIATKARFQWAKAPTIAAYHAIGRGDGGSIPACMGNFPDFIDDGP